MAMSKERGEQFALIVIAILAVCAGSYYLVLRPQWAKWQRVGAERETVEAELDAAETKARNLMRLQGQSGTLQAQVMQNEKLLLVGGSFTECLAIIKRAAEIAGLNLRNVRPRDDVGLIARGNAYGERWVAVDTIAAYHTIGKLMQEIEATSPFIRIVDLTVRANRSTSAGGEHDAFITIGFLVKRAQP